MVEQRPQAVRTRQRRTRVLAPRLVERDARRRDVRERARRVVAEARLLDERLCRPRMSPASAQAPCSAARSASSACASEDLFALRRAPPRSMVAVEVVLARSVSPSSAAQRRGEERGRDSTRSPGRAGRAPGRRRRAPARPRLASCAPAGWRPKARWWRCRPRAGSEAAPSASASHARRPRVVPSGRGASSIDGERGIVHQLVVAEPPEPLLQGLHPAVVVERQRQRVDQPGDVSVSPAACA